MQGSRKFTVASFTAVDDQGNAHRLQVVTTFRTWHGPDGPMEEVVRLDFKKDDGQPVLRLEKGKYELVMSKTVLHSDDPNAP
jgi:hypothetical protein